MFGYVRPLSGEMKVREFETYKAAYCGLCHTLETRCGFLARFVLNYDFVFLAMLLDEGTAPCAVERRRCVAHPFSKRRCAECQGGAMEMAAEETVILTHYKLLDDFKDENLWKRLVSRLFALILTPAYRRAKGRREEFDRRVEGCLGELAELERVGSGRLDQVSDTFARLLQGAAPEEQKEDRRRALEQLLYHLGRWVYLIDGVDDLAEDEAKGRYNLIAARFGSKPDRTYLKVMLDNSLGCMQGAFQLLEENRWKPILENILYLGLPAVQKTVLDKIEETETSKKTGALP